MVRLSTVTGRGALAVGLSAVLGLAGCASEERAARPTPSVTSPASPTAPVPTGPARSDWLADLAEDGTVLYVATHSCPGRVTAGLCTIDSPLPSRLKAYPVSLWRYSDGGWEDLGQPGVFSYSDMLALHGGVLFVPQTDRPLTGGTVTGPLRVSRDEGRTWETWPIPQQQRRCRSDGSGPGFGPCAVAVAGEHVVVASPFGWVRRSIRTGGWEDITPPRRASMSDFDSLGYGLLTLDDGTLVATANASLEPGGFYRVSRDAGSTWSAPHRNPGVISELDHVDRSTVYAMCSTIDSRSGNGVSATQCPWYRSTDLEHWTQTASVAEDGTCARRGGTPSWRETETAVRAGALAYAITSVPYVGGREATRRDLRARELPHRVAHVLESSADDCATWQELVGPTR